uniref:ECF transporter S component n=1 Tax=Thermofilum pendens TaxID=2269 RepID=A0A7C1PLR1_THEPE
MGQEVREIKPASKAVIAAVLIPTIAALNYVGGVIVEALKAPIWGDTWATMLGTLIAGFWVGAAGGFLYNIIMALTVWGLPQWIWGFANVAIALITWLMMKMRWTDLKKPITWIMALILFGFIYNLFCTIINIVVFGGGPLWKPIPAAVYAAVLNATGDFFLANYVQGLSTEIPDKLISFAIAVIIASRVPKRFVLVKV